jgi:hypothetical protein
MDGIRFDEATRALLAGMKSRRTVLGAAAVLGLGEALRVLVTPRGAHAAKRLKQAYRCPGPVEATAGELSGQQRVAQVFTATEGGTLREMRFKIAKFPETKGDYVVQLLKVTGSPNGLPSNSPLDVLAAVTIPDAKVPEGDSTLVANFAGTRLKKGKEYAAVISRPGNSEYAVHSRQGGNDCEGRLFTAFDGDTFNLIANLDLIVTVLVS